MLGNVTVNTSIAVEELLVNGILNVFSVRGACRKFIGDKDERLESVTEQESE
jgi:hypothetical protein